MVLVVFAREYRAVVHALKVISGAEVTKVRPRKVKGGVLLYEVRLGEKVQLTISEECHRSGICEDIPDFPEKEVDDIIDKLLSDKVHFNQDAEVKESRIKEAYDLCELRPTLFRPKAVRDVNYQWYVVLNSNSFGVQKFRGELCLGGHGAPCSRLIYFNNPFHGECVQLFENRNMLVLSTDFKQVLLKPMAVPMCCSCMAVT
ncbi:unnamed protein product [Leptosia nina]|uniref:Spaetzle domain-containing protein n=1 Tax=Leptosia nina TaxID=320188 RepID=A0AAV1J9C3_9NEOP